LEIPSHPFSEDCNERKEPLGRIKDSFESHFQCFLVIGIQQRRKKTIKSLKLAHDQKGYFYAVEKSNINWQWWLMIFVRMAFV
jgi:hypothetical protein